MINQIINYLSKACDPPNHERKAPNFCLDVLLSVLCLRLRNLPAAAKLLTLKLAVEVNHKIMQKKCILDLGKLLKNNINLSGEPHFIWIIVKFFVSRCALH